jgi:hypothetical protein
LDLNRIIAELKAERDVVTAASGGLEWQVFLAG